MLVKNISKKCLLTTLYLVGPCFAGPIVKSVPRSDVTNQMGPMKSKSSDDFSACFPFSEPSSPFCSDSSLSSEDELSLKSENKGQVYGWFQRCLSYGLKAFKYTRDIFEMFYTRDIFEMFWLMLKALFLFHMTEVIFLAIFALLDEIFDGKMPLSIILD